MREPEALTLLGLIARAGQIASGDDMAERMVRSGQAAFVLLDADVSENTRSKYAAMCKSRGICLFMITGGLLGKAIGKPNRMIVVVKKGSLAKKMVTLLM